MPLTSVITAYSPEWPARYDEELDRLGPVLAGSLLAAHHVGSTAVPGLAAKPEIDILLVVASMDRADAWTEGLSHLGYVRGGDLSPGHLFYKRNVDGVRTHKVHVCLEGHAQVHGMLKFRDHLRSNPEVRDRYGALKLHLERNNRAGIGEYLEGKAPFIEEVLSRIE